MLIWFQTSPGRSPQCSIRLGLAALRAGRLATALSSRCAMRSIRNGAEKFRAPYSLAGTGQRRSWKGWWDWLRTSVGSTLNGRKATNSAPREQVSQPIDLGATAVTRSDDAVEALRWHS